MISFHAIVLIVVHFFGVYEPTFEETGHTPATLLQKAAGGIDRTATAHIDDHHRNVCTQIVVHIFDGIFATLSNDGHHGN